jgi:hypothetical protein
MATYLQRNLVDGAVQEKKLNRKEQLAAIEEKKKQAEMYKLEVELADMLGVHTVPRAQEKISEVIDVREERQKGLGLVDFRPVVRQEIEGKIMELIGIANSKFPLEAKHAMVYLHNVIVDFPDERVDLMAYSTIYYYYPNAYGKQGFDIALRQRNAFLSKD